MKNIVLTGFMGTGKTAVGRELSKLLGLKLVEIDSEIERRTGKSIKEIFRDDGEAKFRDLETEVIKEFSDRENLIISTGGGAVMREENIRALKKKGILFCLTAEPESILQRTSRSDERPLLNVDDPLKRIKELLEARRPQYMRADRMINTEGKTPSQVAREIIATLRKEFGNN
ncbi:MAG: shikimate kinase [Nitrospirae bacterium]|nr:MAG: shikimate kinase [Nitrospirota bacterium]